MTKKSSLDRLYVQKPCSTEWDLMEGNDQVRFCTECNKRVYNLSSMTRNQAEGLFTTSGELCGKLERDGKGKIITADQLNRHPFFRIRLPSFTSAAVATLLGIGITVQAEGHSPLEKLISVSSAQSLNLSTDETQARDRKSGIVGTVFDSTKAVIVGARVTIIDEDTNQEHSVATSEEGQYRFEKIAPGTYTIRIESLGFVSFKKTGIALRADKELRIDVTLQVGTSGGLAFLPDSDEARPIRKNLLLPIRAIKRALGVRKQSRV